MLRAGARGARRRLPARPAVPAAEQPGSQQGGGSGRCPRGARNLHAARPRDRRASARPGPRAPPAAPSARRGAGAGVRAHLPGGRQAEPHLSSWVPRSATGPREYGAEGRTCRRADRSERGYMSGRRSAARHPRQVGRPLRRIPIRSAGGKWRSRPCSAVSASSTPRGSPAPSPQDAARPDRGGAGLLLMACGAGAAVSFPLVAVLMRRLGSRRLAIALGARPRRGAARVLGHARLPGRRCSSCSSTGSRSGA